MADKLLHAAAGFAAFWCIVNINLTLAILAVIVIAVCKEVYDYLNPEYHTHDYMDALATIAGGVAAFMLWAVI